MTPGPGVAVPVVVAGATPPADSPTLPTVAAEAEPPRVAAADPIADRLDRAREAYDAKTRAIGQAVLDTLDKQADQVRRSRSKKSAEAQAYLAGLAEQRNIFEANPLALPAALPGDAYQAARAKLLGARTDLETALRDAAGNYARQNKKADAARLRADLDMLREETKLLLRSDSAPAVVVVPAPAPAPVARQPAPPILPAVTHWKFVRRDGAQQPGAFRIIDGRIYHLDQDHQVGTAQQDANGLLYLSFYGHRKLAGEGVVEKVGQGQWSGPFTMLNGVVWQLDMQRTK